MWIMTQNKKHLMEVSQIYSDNNNEILGEDDNPCNIRLGKYDTETQAQLVLRLIANHIGVGKMFFEMPTVEELMKGVTYNEN